MANVSAGSRERFPHEKGDLVLVKWNDGMVYFAKIKRIDHKRQKCTVIFDDRSTDQASFTQIHNVDETTTDIICIKCKKDDSDSPNEIVLCDLCGIGFHQKCHSPPIPASALELNSPWHCIFCLRHIKNPYLTESIDVMQSLFDEEDEEEERGRTIAPLSQPPQGGVKVKIEKDLEKMETVCSSSQSSKSLVPPPPLLQESPTKKRKIGRTRSNEVTTSKHGKMRPLEVLRRKLAKTTSGRVSTNKNPPSRKRSLDTSDYPYNSTTSPNKITRSRGGTVESHTVSVQQVSSSSMEAINTTPSSSAINSADDDGMAGDSESSSLSPVRQVRVKKPRSLRVSLTLPPSVETSPVSSATQKSPPDVMLPWKHPTGLESNTKDDIVAIESSPPDVAVIGGHVTNASTDDESVLYIDLDNNSNTCDTGYKNGDNNDDRLTPVLSTIIDSSTQTIVTNTVIDTLTDTSVNIADNSSTGPNTTIDTSIVTQPSVITTQSDLPKSTDAVPDDVIIIDDNSPHKNHHNKSTATSDDHHPVIKAVPGVTSLMPRKTSVIQKTTATAAVTNSPSPVPSIPSPLEQLQMQVKQQINRTQVRRNSIQNNTAVPRRNSPVANITPTTTEVPPNKSLKVTAPLTHIDEPIVTSSNPINNTTVVSDYIAFSRDIITATRSKKTITPTSVRHTTSETTTTARKRKPSISTRIVQQQHNIVSTSPAAISPATISPATAVSNAVSFVPSVPVPPSIGANGGSVVLTPTTITATGEVATVYTLVHPEQSSDIPSLPYQQTVVSNNEVSIIPSRANTVLSQPTPTQVAVPATVVVQATDLPTPNAAQQQSIGPYYTIMEVNNNDTQSIDRHYPQQQRHIIGSQGQSIVPPINTTKPYAVVNAIPTNPPISQQQITSRPLQSPPGSLMIPPSINHRRKRNIAPAPPLPISPPPYSTAIQQQQKQQTRSSPHALIKQKQPQTINKSVDVITQTTQKTASKITDRDSEQFQYYKQKSKHNFDNLSEEDLFCLFQNAVKKFRENGHKYEALLGGKQLPPPNVEVIDDLGTVMITTRSNQVVKPKPRRLVSHVSPASFRRISPANSQSPPITTTNNEYTTGGSSSRLVSSAQKTVYQTSGVFVPPPDEQQRVISPPNQQQSVITTQQQQVIYHDPKRLLPPNRQLHHPQQQQQITSQQRGQVHQQTSVISQQQQQKLSHHLANQQQYVPITAHHYSSALSSNNNRQQVVQNNNRTYIVSPDSPQKTTAAQLVINHPPSTQTNERKRERICVPCGKGATFLCSGCHVEWYCSRECQLNAWDQHANYCKSLKPRQAIR